MIGNEQAALLVIDMQVGFIDKESSLCVAGAEASIPNCARVIAKARRLDIPVIFIGREYASDGSDVEAVRYKTWLEGGKPLSRAATQVSSLDFHPSLAPKPQDLIIIKPRFSAFFKTSLDEELRKRSLDSLIVIGTTTPNCIRTTCYDALSLNYNVVIIEDATSSRTPEVQQANIADMAYLGAQVLSSDEFEESGLRNIRDIEAEHQNSFNKS